ncbi:hypothetical protein BC834DRAFT_973382 [Gloeopeniophorella convolvens]|nr:hypothetical protein BC834DRAFT_973382 [Gloeopeniophorella convolvens]
MSSDDEPLPRRPTATYGRSRRVDDDETVPDSEDSVSRGEHRPADDDDDNNTITRTTDDGTFGAPRPPRAIYRSRKRAITPPTLSYSSVAPPEEVVPDSEDNARPADASDDDENNNADSTLPSPRVPHLPGLSDWKKQLQDIDDEYGSDDGRATAGARTGTASSTTPALDDPFGSPLTVQPSSQPPEHDTSSPMLTRADATSSAYTSPQVIFGTPQAPSPTPPTSDGNPTPIPRTKSKSKGKARARTPPEDKDATATATSDDALASSPGSKRKTRRREKPKRTKAPTKKELLEARRETARMQSDMRAAISTDATHRLDIRTLLKRFDVHQPAPGAHSQPLQPQSSTSEIEAWSSPSAHGLSRADTDEHPAPARRSPSPPQFRPTGLLDPAPTLTAAYKKPAPDDDPFHVPASPQPADSGSDAEMPDIGAILAARDAHARDKARAEHLQRVKLAALQQQAQRGADDDSDDGLDVVDDSMHAVARAEAAARASGKSTRPSAGRARQLRFAHIAAGSSSPVRDDAPETRLAAAARPAFAPAGAGRALSKAELERMVLRSAEAQSAALRREKEDEWVRRGGRVGGVMPRADGAGVRALIGEALKAPRGGDMGYDRGGDEDEDEDEEDGEYVPVERGSASPEPMDADGDGDAEQDENAAGRNDQDHEGTDADSEADAGPRRRAPSHRPKPRRAVIASDDEDAASDAGHAPGDFAPPPPPSLPPLPSPGFASQSQSQPPPYPHAHALTDDDTDKENAPALRLDDDKENHPAPTRTPRARALADELRALPAPPPALAFADDDPFVFTPSPAKAREEALRRLASPTPFRSKRGLSQLFEDEDGADDNDDAGLGPGLKPVFGGLSQAFEQTQVRAPPRPHRIDDDGAYFGYRRAPAAGGFAALRRPADAELSLTLEAHAAALQPALDVDAHTRARADALFVREQELLVAAALPARAPQRELYITENGYGSPDPSYPSAPPLTRAGRFLTQTRPEGSSPLVYRPPPTQAPALTRAQSDGATAAAARQPLSTLTETQAQALHAPSPSPGGSAREPLRRLRRAHTSPTPVRAPARALSPSPSPSPSPSKGQGAFAALMLGARREQDGARAAGKRRAAAFVEDQAAESDEEDMLGFGARRRPGAQDDDEEDDAAEEDADGVVAELVDDAQMDEAALARARVLEKHQEQEEAADARLERAVQDVVAGKRRTRARTGGLLGSDGSSDDDDDEDARARRARVAKRRRVAGDTLDALAADPATAAFHASYASALVDGAEEFAHLARGAEELAEREEQPQPRDGDGDEDVEMEERDDDGEEEGEGARRGAISAAEVRSALRDIARGEREYTALDPHDVSWLDPADADADPALPRMRLATRAPKAPVPALDADADAGLLHLRARGADPLDAAFAQRMQRWAREEGAAGVGARGGNARGSAVTGHRVKVKATAKAAPSAAQGKAAGAGAVRKAASALSAVADRRGRFGA